MKDMPRETRPYERCFANGPKSLSDEELLAVIIRTGGHGKNSVELAREILTYMGKEGIGGLSTLTGQELTQIRGIGMVKAVQLLCVGELAARIAKHRRRETLSFQTPASVAEYYMEEMRHKQKEEVLLLLLDAKSKLIREITVSIGTVDYAVASPREVFIEALRYQAVGIIMLHNHPSGDPTPSRMDLVSTRQIREAGELIGISLIDHIIIGDNNYTSFSEKKLL